jgi:hypothetical protein
MLQIQTLPTSNNLIRAQFSMFHAHCDQVGLSGDDRRRALELDDRTWMAWTDFLSDGRLPPEPPLPEMLRRLGETAYYLSVIADQAAGQG